jgi:transposase
MRSGCAWRQLPTDLPPWSTVYRWFATCRDACLFEKINHALVTVDRERIGRQASPSAAIIDSQSVKTTEAGVNKHPDQIGFTVLPRRWVVERFFAWVGRNSRLAKDFEATIASARAFLYAASIMLLSRRIARAA